MDDDLADMTPRELMTRASAEALHNSYNGMNEFQDALSDWWKGEAQAHFHAGDGNMVNVYDLPGMEHSPAVRAARAYLRGDH